MKEFSVISPVDGSVYAQRHYASVEEINAALARAQLAQPQWHSTALAQRQQLCSAMVDAFLDNSDEIARQICWQMGRPLQYAAGEVRGLAERARYMIEVAPQALRTIELEEQPGFTRYIKCSSYKFLIIISNKNI